MSSDAPGQLSSAGQKFYNAIRKMVSLPLHTHTLVFLAHLLPLPPLPKNAFLFLVSSRALVHVPTLTPMPPCLLPATRCARHTI